MMNVLPKDHLMATTPCPDRDQLLDYLLGKLPDDISEQIAAHLDQCPTCESAAETLDQVSDTMVSELNRPLTRGQFESEPQYQEALQRVLALAGAESGTAGDSVRTLGEVAPDLGQLGEYRLLEKLGEGGMGAVYKAQHTKLDKLVALKVLPKDRMQNPTAVSRFECEMKAVGRLNHPHIVQAHDAREIDGRRCSRPPNSSSVSAGRTTRPRSRTCRGWSRPEQVFAVPASGAGGRRCLRNPAGTAPTCSGLQISFPAAGGRFANDADRSRGFQLTESI